MKQLYFFLFLSACVAASAQTLPSLNSGVLPNDSDPICSTPWYNNIDFDTAGYDLGETVNDFTLFDLNGNAFQLSAALAQGKPVLLIAGNLTCPVFRNQMNDINTVVSAYSSYITPMVVYGIEAHPTDTSPYSGTINITNQNLSQGILFPQPTTYLERKNLADTLIQNFTVNFPMVIDGPCNEVWHAYGPAPQNAYLIDTNGVVILKHGWFHQYPDNIYCELDSILNITLPYCAPTSASGSFILNPLVTAPWGPPGQIIYASADIINNSADDALIEVMKMTEIYAAGWNSSFCMGICYLTTVDSTAILLAPGDTMHFTLDFFTSPTPDSSRVRVGFRNVNNQSNAFSQWFYGYTSPVGIVEENSKPTFTVVPNPCTDQIVLQQSTASDNATYVIRDLQGRTCKTISMQENTSGTIDVSDLPAGVYIIALESDGRPICSRFVKL
jgi:hypothetical protein